MSNRKKYGFGYGSGSGKFILFRFSSGSINSIRETVREPVRGAEPVREPLSEIINDKLQHQNKLQIKHLKSAHTKRDTSQCKAQGFLPGMVSLCALKGYLTDVYAFGLHLIGSDAVAVKSATSLQTHLQVELANYPATSACKQLKEQWGENTAFFI